MRNCCLQHPPTRVRCFSGGRDNEGIHARDSVQQDDPVCGSDHLRRHNRHGDFGLCDAGFRTGVTETRRCAHVQTSERSRHRVRTRHHQSPPLRLARRCRPGESAGGCWVRRAICGHVNREPVAGWAGEGFEQVFPPGFLPLQSGAGVAAFGISPCHQAGIGSSSGRAAGRSVHDGARGMAVRSATECLAGHAGFRARVTRMRSSTACARSRPCRRMLCRRCVTARRAGRGA